MDGDIKWWQRKEENNNVGDADVIDDKMLIEPNIMYLTFSHLVLPTCFPLLIEKTELREVSTLPKVIELEVVDLRCNPNL